jgi:regulator of nucleoside diphosphate kinase
LLIVTAADLANLSLLESPGLARRLAHATVVPSNAVPSHIVTMYSRVLCVDPRTGERKVLRLVYPEDRRADEADVSVLAPAGMALLGAATDQEIQFEREDGALRYLRVVEVLYQPEHDLGTRLIVNSRRTPL